MNATIPTTPFKPVSKGDAAELLGVSTKTIDNYIRAGLLPAPRPFGGRELWHPDAFYTCLRDALMPAASTPADEQTATSPHLPDGLAVASSQRKATRSAKDSSPMVRQRSRQAELLARLNGPALG